MTAVPHPGHDDHDLALVTRASLLYMLLWMIGFTLLAIIARIAVPALHSLSVGGSAVFIVMSSGFGIIPGMMHGVGAAEAELEGRHG